MDANWLTRKIYDIATNYFHKWYGLLCSVFLIGVVSLLFYKLIPEGKITFRHYTYGALSVGTILCLYWIYHVWHYPKRSKDRLGVAIAIQTENLEDENYLNKDFLVPFREKIHELNLPFDVLVLKNHQSQKVDTVEDARRILSKTKAHFCVWGSVKKRKNAPEGQRYLFALRGIVVHKPIQEVQSVLLRQEFDALLPNKLAFEDKLQFEAFEFRANQLFSAVDYITGRAALLSGDCNIAIRLHEPLLKTMESGYPCPVSKETLKKLLSLEYDLKAGYEFLNSGMSQEYVNAVNTTLHYDDKNYGGLLKKAIVEFNGGQGDSKKALKTIREAKKYSQGYHWLYSEAFLLFWMGKYAEALKCCDKLKDKSFGGENITIGEVESFNLSLLKSYEKPQLYYWLGFINFAKKKNFSLADTYFQTLLDKSDNTMLELKTRATSYLSSIKQEIGYTT